MSGSMLGRRMLVIAYFAGRSTVQRRPVESGLDVGYMHVQERDRFRGRANSRSAWRRSVLSVVRRMRQKRSIRHVECDKPIEAGRSEKVQGVTLRLCCWTKTTCEDRLLVSGRVGLKSSIAGQEASYLAPAATCIA